MLPAAPAASPSGQCRFVWQHDKGENLLFTCIKKGAFGQALQVAKQDKTMCDFMCTNGLYKGLHVMHMVCAIAPDAASSSDYEALCRGLSRSCQLVALLFMSCLV